MYYTYVLYCKKAKKLYTGFTSNLKRRITEHRAKKVYSTKRLAGGDLSLIFYEAFLNEEDARRREKYLKTTKGKRSLKIMLRRFFENV